MEVLQSSTEDMTKKNVYDIRDINSGCEAVTLDDVRTLAKSMQSNSMYGTSKNFQTNGHLLLGSFEETYYYISGLCVK